MSLESLRSVLTSHESSLPIPKVMSQVILRKIAGVEEVLSDTEVGSEFKGMLVKAIKEGTDFIVADGDDNVRRSKAKRVYIGENGRLCIDTGRSTYEIEEA